MKCYIGLASAPRRGAASGGGHAAENTSDAFSTFLLDASLIYYRKMPAMKIFAIAFFDFALATGTGRRRYAMPPLRAYGATLRRRARLATGQIPARKHCPPILPARFQHDGS